MKTAQCALCARPFRYRSNKRYCSDRCRFQAWIKGKDDEATPCYYCGMPADSIDHVPPRCVRPILIETGVTRWPFKEVDACQECNSTISAEPPWTLGARKERIKAKLRKKYAHYLNIPNWSPEELDSFEQRGVLGHHIREGVIIKELVRKRLDW